VLIMRDLLKGHRVLDFSQIGAGPTCGMLLADFGADVIKIEPPSGDMGRDLGPPWYGSQSPMTIAFNRGKRSICVDLRKDDGLALVRELAGGCDVIVESFRPGVMQRFGLSYDDLTVANPRLVYCAVSGYGQTGPYAQRAGVDGILQAASGLMGLIGVDDTEPCKVQAPVVDIFTGYVGALGVICRLLEREKTGKGGFVDVSLFGSAIALQQSAITAYLGDPVQPTKLGSAAPYSAPNEAFRAKDGWIMVAAYMQTRWRKLCEVLDRCDLIDDERFCTSSQRVVNRPALRKDLNREFATGTCAEWLAALDDNDILCSKIADYADVVQHAQLQHLKLVVDMQHRVLGSLSAPGNPINPIEMNNTEYRAPPLAGEDTRDILRELGTSDVRIDRLLASGALVIPENQPVPST
jgi:crotonobetainyl-CoA:carnitine CoA-transferase CaiB-like acyl-CoA transferase